MHSDKRRRLSPSKNASESNSRGYHESRRSESRSAARRTPPRTRDVREEDRRDGPTNGGPDGRMGRDRVGERAEAQLTSTASAARKGPSIGGSSLFGSSWLEEAKKLVETQKGRGEQESGAAEYSRSKLVRERELAQQAIAGSRWTNGEDDSDSPGPSPKPAGGTVSFALRQAEEQRAFLSQQQAVEHSSSSGASEGEDAGPGSGGAGRWGGEADDAEDAEEGEILEMPQPDSKRSRWTDPFSDEEDEEPEATAAAGAAAGAAANPHENGASPLSAAMEDPDGDLNQRERLELAQSGDGDTQGSPGTSPHGRRQAPTPDGSAGRQPGDGEADAEAHTPPPQQLPRGSEASASPLLQHREAEGEAGRGHNMLMECRSITAYELGKRVAEGTYGIVFRGHVRGQPRKQVAIKKIKMQRGLEGFPLTSIREINIMLALKHPAIVNVSEVVVGKSMDDIYMVMDWMEYDLKYFLEKYGAGGAAGERRRLTIPQVKCIMLQLLAGLDYMHNNWVLHRDMKPSNILLNHIGEVKICDFGMARMYGSPLRNYTELVITRWYRPPELFCGQRQYDGAVDIWSLGAIMAELLTGQALFCNRSDNELSMIDTITDVMGSPCADNPWRSLEGMPHIRKGKLKAEAWFKGNKKCRLEEKLPMKQGMFDDLNTKLSAAGLDLLKRMLAFEPSQRVTAADALQHDWFTVDVPLACDKALLPTLGTERGAAHAHVPHRPPRLQPSPDAVQAQLAWPARGTLLRGAAPR